MKIRVSDHADQRATERFNLDLVAHLGDIAKQIQDGSAPLFARQDDGRCFYGVGVGDLGFVAVIAADGEIVTVLAIDEYRGTLRKLMTESLKKFDASKEPPLPVLPCAGCRTNCFPWHFSLKVSEHRADKGGRTQSKIRTVGTIKLCPDCFEQKHFAVPV